MIRGLDTNILRSIDFGGHFVFMQIRWSNDTTYLENVALRLGKPNLSNKLLDLGYNWYF